MYLEEFIETQKRLLELERSEEVTKSKLLTECSPKILEEKNLCIRKLCIINIFTGLYGRTILEFQSSQKKDESDIKVFNQGDIIGIYSDSCKSAISKTLATGLFYKSNKDAIQIALDNNTDNDEEFLKDSDTMTFRLIKLSSEVTYSRLKSGLKYLENRSKPLCGDYLIDLLLGNSLLSTEKPLKDIKYFNEKLNTSQQNAVLFALSRPDIAIIHGPPGTGKTTVAVEIINQSLAINTEKKSPKILVCTPSNIALDNLAEKLINSHKKYNGKSKSKKINVLRLGHCVRVMPHLSDISLDYKLSNCDQAELILEIRSQIDSTLKQVFRKNGEKMQRNRRSDLSELRKELKNRELKAVREVLSSSDVIMSTLTGLRSNKSLPLNEIEFDVVLIDEASQAIEAACWLAIPRGKKLILAGDHKQLPPTVLCDEAIRQGLSLSLMERLLNLYPDDQITRMLSIQYRMHENIMRWSSDSFYHSQLIADSSVSTHLLQDIFSDTKSSAEEPIAALTFIDTAGCDLYELDCSQEDSKANLGEAQLAAVYIEQLLSRFELIGSEHIGVITPYARQAQLIKETIKNRMELSRIDYSQIEVSTVDGFQGREKEVIITTLVRSNPSGIIGFLAEHRRLNVALTRAKRHLCVIGDSSTIEHSGDSVLQTLVSYWNHVADVRTAFDYIYEYDISAGDCVKPAQKQPKIAGEVKKVVKTAPVRDLALENRVLDQLRAFHMSDTESRLEFPAELNSAIRAQLHELAESLQLQHKSVGEGRRRRFVAEKTLTEPPRDDQYAHREVQEVTTAQPDFKVEEKLQCVTLSNVEEVDISQQPVEINKNHLLCDVIEPIVKNCKLPVEHKVRLPNHQQPVINIAAQQSIKSDKKQNDKNKKQKTSHSKATKQQPLANVPDDFDGMLAHFQNLDKVCQHSEKCKTPVSVLGFNCPFCKKRFCATHAQPEVHLCPLATRQAWIQFYDSPRPVSNSKKIKHNQLSKAMNKKLHELSDNRRPQKKSEEK